MEQRSIVTLTFVDNICEVVVLAAGKENETTAVEAGVYVRTETDTVGDIVDTRCGDDNVLIHTIGPKPGLLSPRDDMGILKSSKKSHVW